MTFEEFFIESDATSIYNKSTGVIYPALGLAGEAGEVADEVKKAIRMGIPEVFPENRKENIFFELGDVLWYWCAMCRAMGFNPEEVMQANVDKLKARYNK